MAVKRIMGCQREAKALRVGLISALLVIVASGLANAAPGVSHKDCTNCHEGQSSSAAPVTGVFRDTLHSTEITITAPAAYNDIADRCQKCHDVDSDAQKLLRKPFSQLCVDCHGDKANAIGSRHDISYASDAPYKGACLSCHAPHPKYSGALNISPLWARDMTTETALFNQVANPNYIVDRTILCYDCHSSSEADNDPDLAAFDASRTPQDIAFREDGPGDLVGYYETDPTTATPPGPAEIAAGAITGGHYIKSAGSTGIERGDKLPCKACHELHDSEPSNEAFIRNPLAGKTVTGLKASQSSRNGSGTGRAICTACHGYGEPGDAGYSASVALTEVDPAWGGVDRIVTRPGSVTDHNPASTTACTSCHNHDRIEADCGGCHGYPPQESGIDDAAPGGYAGGIGAHQVHTSAGFQCFTCHGHNGSGPNHGGSAGRITVLQENVDIVFDPALSFPGGTTLYNAGYPFAERTTPTNPSCVVGCHNPVVFYPTAEATPNLTNVIGWDDGLLGVWAADSSPVTPDIPCKNCHDAQATAMDQGSVDGLTYRSSHQIDTSARVDCQVCHAIDQHRSGAVVLKNNDDASTVSWEWSENSTDTASIAGICLSCHDSDANQPFSVPGTPPDVENGWSGAAHNSVDSVTRNLTCFGGAGACHGNPHGSAKLHLLGQSNVAPAYNATRGDSEEEGFCFNCHDTAANSAAGIDILQRFTANSNPLTHHNVTSVDQAAAGSKVECLNCHGPHINNAANKNVDPDSRFSNYTAQVNDITLYPKAVLQPGPIPGKDSMIWAFQADTQFGTAQSLSVGRNFGNPVRALLEFDLSGIPAGATITSATFSMPQQGGVGASALNISLYRVTSSWAEAGATWNSAPTIDSTPVSTVSTNIAYAWRNWSATTLVQGWLDGSYQNNGVELMSTAAEASATDWYRSFYSSDRPLAPGGATKLAERPRLTIQYTSDTPPQTVDKVSFCGRCHDDATPAGVIVPGTVRQIVPNYTNSGASGDIHGAKAGTNPNNYGELIGPYYFGIGALSCAACHDSHGSQNAFALKETVNGNSGVNIPVPPTAATSRSLCVSCHTFAHDLGQPCFNCHFHGANADASALTAF